MESLPVPFPYTRIYGFDGNTVGFVRANGEEEMFTGVKPLLRCLNGRQEKLTVNRPILFSWSVISSCVLMTALRKVSVS